METMKKTVPYLPNELIIQILLKLPVKSLIRFKCVCKSWFSIISDSHFANSHFQLTASTHIDRALFISNTLPHQTRSIELESSLVDDTSLVSLNPNFMHSEHFSRIEIKGSCRGFILLHCSSTFFLWNPSTGLHKPIPLSPLRFDLDLDKEAGQFYGFGYNRSTDDYLIVLISSDTNTSYLDFFAFRANKWEQIDECTHIHYSFSTEGDPKLGLFFNGAIHWFAYCLHLQTDVILTIDLMERKFLDMHFPDELDLEIDYYSGLWVFREYLSLWAMNYDNDTVEIWVMKEYKVHSSWTKTHVLLTHAIPTKYFFPVCSTKSGDIVGTDDHTELVKYNDQGQLLGHRSYGNNPHGFQVAIFTESLLSLPGDSVQA